jgi:hypothetical protein
MDLQWRDGDSEARFGTYVEELSRVMGHSDRVEPFRTSCIGSSVAGQMQERRADGDPQASE